MKRSLNALAVLLLVSCAAVPASAGGNQTLNNSWAAINYATAGAIALSALRGPGFGPPVAQGWGGPAWGAPAWGGPPAWGATVVLGPSFPAGPVWAFPAPRPGVVMVPGPDGWESRQVVRGCVPSAAGAWICGGQLAR